jgi:hypothetical protein
LQWGAWAHSRSEWADEAEALLAGIDAQQRILDAQQDRMTRELRLKRTQGLGGLAAACLVRQGQTEQALVALERGRGLLAAEQLKRRPDQITFAGICEKAANQTLVYVDNVGGGVVLLLQDGAIESRSFPGLDEKILNPWLDQNLGLREAGGESWERALDGICCRLWDELMGDLITALNPRDEVTLVAGGYLAMLPLHAAWTKDSSRPTGRLYATDILTIRYAPSATVLRSSPPPGLASILCVDEPAPVKAPPLPFSKAEVQVAAAEFPQKTIFRKTKARRSAVLKALPGHEVLHLSCHGHANLQEPLQNGLAMGGGEFLTLKDLLELNLEGVALAVLSACDTGLMGTRLPDETVSLPAGMLTAGVRGVVSPLWPINSFTTLLLMARFYRCLCRDHLTPGEALRVAQNWLRDTTNEEKSGLFQGQPAIYRELLLREPEERSESGIGQWAAFCYNGA